MPSLKANASGYTTACTLAATTAFAQVPPDAGSIFREQQKPALELPKPTPAIKLEEPARPALPREGVTRFVLKSLSISGNTVFTQSELLALVQDYIGREVGFDDLDAAAARISRYYRERGYIVARAYLPGQQIIDGAVEIAVVEGRFGKVGINNRSRVRDGVVERFTSALPGSVVTERNLERKLLLLDDLAGVDEARGTLSPGTNVGESDLSVEITPAPSIDGSVELDNYGNRFTGAWRLTGRVNVASPLRLGDALNGFFTKAFDGLEYGGLGYQIPLGGDGLKLGTAYSKGHYRLGRSFSALDANGDFDTYSVSVSYAFIRSRNFNVYGRAGHAWNDFQDRVGATASSTDKSTRVYTLTLHGDARDSSGITLYSIGYNGGRLDIETPAARAIDDATARTHGHFNRWNLNALRIQSLGERLSAHFLFAGQKADGNLDSSEKFILGGANGVRAYPQGEASGDTGWLVTAELRYTLAFPSVPGVLQPFVFVDAGRVKVNENPFAAIDNTRRLAGAGIGVSWASGRDFQVKMMIATRIGSEPSRASDSDRHTRGWVQAVKYF
ncbi:MAG TPA: ShlB/FhaC/HecB family hemolysin secretion/activation protein [Burkholderiales bacterium]|nr:ShlB/FhaC/HecB family hemolysin secretion/activation protein [Burkholderiales bacterium]